MSDGGLLQLMVFETACPDRVSSSSAFTKALQQHRWFCSSVRGNTQDQLQGCENTSCQFHQDAGSPPRPGLKYTRTQHPETNTRSICQSGTLTFVIKFYISSSLTVCRAVLTQVGFSWNSAVMLLDRCGQMWTDVSGPVRSRHRNSF